MRHGSLFSGIGGFDLASEWMGWENVFHCEWNEFGKRVLKYYWPKAKSYDDITKTDFTIHRGRINILTGGFPCQPYSTAGKRLGKEDDRHLWPEMLRAIREIQPTWVVGENVLGITNWNEGLVFDEVQADLEAEGYKVQAYILPAASVNAPHRRDRTWFIAHSRYSEPQGWKQSKEDNDRGSREGFKQRNKPASCSCDGYASDTDSLRLQRGQAGSKLQGREKSNEEQPEGRNKFSRQDWQKFPTQPPVCNGNDGLSSRLDGITFPKWRNESIKAGGNAIVPQVVHQIFKAIEQYESQS